MTGFDSKRKIALDRLDDDDIQIYAQPSSKRPIEADYTSQVAYTRALELFCDTLAQPEQEPKPDELTVVYMSGVFEGRKLEREACAKVAEDMNRAVLAMLNVTSQPKALAAAIRARGNT